ncbi:MAG: hypothetical protein NTV52_23375 [Acidobacteria bacterium]|nr:hypothetical protein [Acidobacteriota bacterium]
MSIQTETMKRVEALPMKAQQDLLTYIDQIPTEPASPGYTAALLQRVGTLDPIDAQEMMSAIEEGCGKIDESGW